MLLTGTNVLVLLVQMYLKRILLQVVDSPIIFDLLYTLISSGNDRVGVMPDPPAGTNYQSALTHSNSNTLMQMLVTSASCLTPPLVLSISQPSQILILRR